MNAQFSLQQYGPQWLRQSINIVENDKYQLYYDQTSQQNEMLMTIGIPISNYQTHEIKSQFQIKDDFFQLTLEINSPESINVRSILSNLLEIIYRPQFSKINQTQLQQLLEYHINDYYDILAYSQLRNKSYKEINIDLQNIQNANSQISKMMAGFHKQNIEKSPFILFVSAPSIEFQEQIIETCEECKVIYGIKSFNQNISIQPNTNQVQNKDVKMFLTHDIKQNNQICTLSIYGIATGTILNMFAIEVQQFILEWLVSPFGPITNIINKIYYLEDENPQQMHQISLQTNILEKCFHYKIIIQNVNGLFSERLLWELQNFLSQGIFDYIERLTKQNLNDVIKYNQLLDKNSGLHQQIINDMLKFSLLKRSNQLYITPVDVYGPIQLLDVDVIQQCLEKHQFLQIYDYWTHFNINITSQDKYDLSAQNCFINSQVLHLQQYFQDVNSILSYIQTIEVVNGVQNDFNLHLLQGNQNVFIGNQNTYNKIVHSAISIGSKRRTQQIILHLVTSIKTFFDTAIKCLMNPSNLIIQIVAGWKYSPKVQAKKLLRQKSSQQVEQINESTIISEEQQQPQTQFIQDNSRTLLNIISLYSDEQESTQNRNIIATTTLKKLFAQTNFQGFSGIENTQQDQAIQEQQNSVDTSFNNGVNLQQQVIENIQKTIQLECQIPNQHTDDTQMQYQQIYQNIESKQQIQGHIIQYKVPHVLNSLFLNILQNQQLQDYYINYDQHTNKQLISYVITYLQQGIEYESDQDLLSQFKNYLKNATVRYNKLISNIYIEIEIKISINLEHTALPLEFCQYINYLVIIYNKMHSQIQFQYEDNHLQIQITATSIQQLQDLFKLLIDRYVHKKIMYDDVYIMTFTNLDIAKTVRIIKVLHDYIWVNNIISLNHTIKFSNCAITLLPQHANYQQQYNTLMQQICYNCYSYLIKLFDIMVKKFQINNEHFTNSTDSQDNINISDVCNKNIILEVKECISNDIGIFIINLTNNFSDIEVKVIKYYYQCMLEIDPKITQLQINIVSSSVLHIILRASQQSMPSIVKLINLQECLYQLRTIQYLRIYQQLMCKLEYPIIFMQNILQKLKTNLPDVRTIVITRQIQSDQQEQMKKQKGQYEQFLEQKKILQQALNVTEDVYKAILSSGNLLQYLYVYKDRIVYTQGFNVDEHLETIKQITVQQWKLQQAQQINNVYQQIKKQKQSILLKNQKLAELESKMDEYDSKYKNIYYNQVTLQVAYSRVIVTQMLQKQQFNLKQQQQLQQLHEIQDEQKKKNSIDILYGIQLQTQPYSITIQQNINDDINSKVKYIKQFQFGLFKTLKKMFNITGTGHINGYAIQPFHQSQKIIFKTVPQVNLSHGYIYQKQETSEENDEFLNYQEIQKLIKQDKIFQIETALYNACQLIEYLRIIAEIQLPNPILISGLHTSFIHLSTKYTLQPLSIDIVNGACEYTLQSDQKPKIRVLKGQSMFQSNAPIGDVIPIGRDILPDADKYNVCIRLLAEDVAKLSEYYEVRITKSNLILALNEILNQQLTRLNTIQ